MPPQIQTAFAVRPEQSIEERSCDEVSTTGSNWENLMQDVTLPAAPGKVHGCGLEGMHLNCSGLSGMWGQLSLLATRPSTKPVHVQTTQQPPLIPMLHST